MSAALQAVLTEALGAGAIAPQNQPIVALDTGALVGVEALVRWRRHDGGVAPAALVRATAAGAGHAPGLAQAMLEAALEAFAAAPWSSGLRLSVNATAAELERGSYAARLAAAARGARVSPERLTVELTEEERPGDMAALAAALHDVQAEGMAVAADDFGAGYAGLSWLLALPLNGLKLDQGFAAALPHPAAAAAARAVAQIAADLGLKLTAEGVETEEQRRAFAAMGYGFGQGRLFGMPRDDGI